MHLNFVSQHNLGCVGLLRHNDLAEAHFFPGIPSLQNLVQQQMPQLESCTFHVFVSLFSRVLFDFVSRHNLDAYLHCWLSAGSSTGSDAATCSPGDWCVDADVRNQRQRSQDSAHGNLE